MALSPVSIVRWNHNITRPWGAWEPWVVVPGTLPFCASLTNTATTPARAATTPARAATTPARAATTPAEVPLEMLIHPPLQLLDMLLKHFLDGTLLALLGSLLDLLEEVLDAFLCFFTILLTCFFTTFFGRANVGK